MQSDYVNCGKLRSLHPILKEWIRLNRRYCKNASWKDCAWWNNERASTGILAASVWTLGGVALEEYVTRKVRKGEQGTGRCDLEIQTGRSKFVCEIKQKFLIPRDRRNNGVGEVKTFFDMACNDARKLPLQEARRLGICFITPRFLHSQIPYDSCLENFLTRLHRLEYDAIAWYFPPKARDLRWHENNRIFPGAIILIREIFRSR